MHIESNDAIPFIVAISGHRDPRAPEDVMQRCREVFQFVQEKSPNTPKILLSGMAEGADQIAAKVAIEMGWQVVAVLPMPYEDYQNDFDGIAQMHLAQLLEGCKQVIELPLVDPEQVDSDVSEPRQQQYRNLGVFMIRHAQLMVLCWDGDDSLQALPGGTLEVGRCCKVGVAHESASVLKPLRTVDTVWIPTPRLSQPESATKAAAQHKLPYECNTAWYTTLKLINRFNTTTKSQKPVFQKQKKQSKDWLLGTETHSPKLNEQFGPQLDVYAQADAISMFQQTLRNKVVGTIIIALFFALLAQGIYSGPIMALSYLVIHVALLGIGWGVYHWFFKVKQLDTHYLDYRALAEGLRVQLFWQLHGIQDCVADHYLHSCNREVYWISESIRNLKLYNGYCGDVDEQSHSLTRKQWIEGQRNYFLGEIASKSGKAYQHKLKAQKARNQVKSFLVIGVLLTLITLGLHGFSLGENLIDQALVPATDTLSAWINYLLLAIMFSFGLSAGTAMYAEIQGHEERAASYLFTGNQFDVALGRYDAAEGDRQTQDAIVLELGKEALSENANWLINHRKVTQSFINPY